MTPVLLADKPSYTFGVRFADPKRDAGRDLKKDAARTIQEHQSYKDLIRACAETTGDADMARGAAFLDSWDTDNPAINLPAELGRDDLLTFRVDGRLPMEDVKVQAFWAQTAAGGRAEETEKELELGLPAKSAMQCLISGENGPVEEMMPVPVKGLPGKKSEMAIVSANANAFESYGLTRAQTSPISREAAERFGQALNAVLGSDRPPRPGRQHHLCLLVAATEVPLFASSSARLRRRTSEFDFCRLDCSDKAGRTAALKENSICSA